MTPLKSSFIDSADYDPVTKQLSVTLRGQRVYTYADVPPEVFRELTLAQSAGSYFNDNIKSTYEAAQPAQDTD
jgi:hypothetical protein